MSNKYVLFFEAKVEIKSQLVTTEYCGTRNFLNQKNSFSFDFTVKVKLVQCSIMLMNYFYCLFTRFFYMKIISRRQV